MATSSIEEIRAEASRLKSLYDSNAKVGKLHGLVLGEKGAGKTSLALTCPRPVYIASFDPGSTSILDAEIKKGDILVDYFEQDDRENPSAYMAFEKEYRRKQRLGFFNHVGTTIIDSATNLATYLSWQIQKKEGRISPGLEAKRDGTKHGMQKPDWDTFLNVMIQLSISLGNLPCHTILTGHIARVFDEAKQTFVRTMMIPGQSKDRVPINLHESYVLKVQASSSGLKRMLLTQNDGEFQATTRLKGVSKEEEPDIRALLKKAGLPYEDLPRLV